MSTLFTAFILCMCCHCHIGHLISRIRNVYIWYIHSYTLHDIHLYAKGALRIQHGIHIYSITLSYHSHIHTFPEYSVHIVYLTCIHLVSFSKAVYTTIIQLRFLKRIHFPIVSVVRGCLLLGSTPPRRPGQQHKQLFPVLEGSRRSAKWCACLGDT